VVLVLAVVLGLLSFLTCVVVLICPFICMTRLLGVSTFKALFGVLMARRDNSMLSFCRSSGQL